MLLLLPCMMPCMLPGMCLDCLAYLQFFLHVQAMDICITRVWGEEKMAHLFEQMTAYRANATAYQRSLPAGAEPDEWWDVVGKGLPKEADGTPAIISIFSRMLLSAVPHAADPERAFSGMGLDHSELRNRFLQSTVGQMALVRSYNRIAIPDEE